AYEHLLRQIDRPALVELLREDAERAVWFLGIRDTPLARQGLIRELHQAPGADDSRALAVLTWALGSNQQSHLRGVDAVQLCAVFRELQELGVQPAWVLSDNKVRRLAALLCGKIMPGAVGHFLRTWLAGPAPEEFALGQAVLSELVRNHRPTLLAEVPGLPADA